MKKRILCILCILAVAVACAVNALAVDGVGVKARSNDQGSRNLLHAVAKNFNRVMDNATLWFNGTHIINNSTLTYSIGGKMYSLAANTATSLAGINDYAAMRNNTTAELLFTIDSSGKVNATLGAPVAATASGNATRECPDTGFDVAVFGGLTLYSSPSRQLDLDNSGAVPLVASSDSWFYPTTGNPKYALTE